jgi:hypothetical protein
MFTNLLITLEMWWVGVWHWRRFVSKADHPRETQMALLRTLLATNARTTFGKRFGFDGIQTHEQYRKSVSIQSYEDLRPYVMRQCEQGTQELTIESPVFYVQTSGTTSHPKLIPIIPSALRAYRASQKLVSYSIHTTAPGAYAGRLFIVVSSRVEGRLENGTPFGSMSGLNYDDMPSIVQKKYVLSGDVLAIKDYDDRYRRMAALAVSVKNVTLLGSANPSTFLKLLETVNARRKRPRTLADLWPGLKAVVTWTGGSAGLLIPELKKNLPKGVKIIETGYLASEFRGTITLPNTDGEGLPDFEHTFFEFVLVSQRDRGPFLLLDQLEMGKQYYIFVTTRSGLYRYDVNDIIEVTGWYRATPTIRFVQKGKGVTSITGEKLYEGQVAQVVRELVERSDLSVQFYIMLADEQAAQYILNIECDHAEGRIADELEQGLRAVNIEYAAKAKSGRLHPVIVRFLTSGTGEAYKRYRLDAGMRESQYKTVNLQYKKDCDFPFENYVIT